MPARWMRVNAFLADVRDGMGPYRAIHLVSVRGPTHGWNEALVDRIKAKRALLVVASLLPVAVAAMMLGTGRFSAALGLALLWFKMPETAER